MSTTTLQKRYYPALSSVVTAEDLPDILGFIKDGVQNLLSQIYYKDFQHSKGAKGDSAFYGLSIVSPQRIQLEIPGTDIYLVLNPDLKDGVNDISIFPITIEYQWKVLAYLREFSLGNFSFSPQEIFEVAMRVLNVTEEQAIAHFVNTFVETTDQDLSPLHKFVQDLNAINSTWNLQIPTEDTTITDVVKDIFSKTGKYATLVAFGAYILTSDPKETLQKVKDYFRAFIPQDIDEFIKEVIVPKFRATLLLSAGIEFPRSILQPVDQDRNVINADNNGNPKVMLTFGEALFYADTTKGFGYNMDLRLNTTTPAMIGNTGLVIDIHNLKIDLSKKENILEADLDGRPKDFMGVYMERTDVFLPPKWFKKQDDTVLQDNQTLGIFTDHLLVGTGGVSGTVGLKATYKTDSSYKIVGYFQNVFTLDYTKLYVIKDVKENTLLQIKSYDELITYAKTLTSPSQLKFQFPITLTYLSDNITQVFYSESDYYKFLNSLEFDAGNYMWFKLGANESKQWDLGFNKFDITFHQGTVVNSNLHAALKIKKFTDEEGLPAVITLDGEYHSKDEFRLSANFLAKPQRLNLFNSIYLYLQTAELGRLDNDFFIGADTIIDFPEGTLAHKLFKGKSIDLPAIRIYSNGRFEIVGGVSKIPVNFEMNLGPAKMNVTSLHLGTVQLEHNGKMRTYNFIGFDGGINVNPGGLDVKGDGVKYYYTVDNDLGLESHSFFHISTLEVEITIPGGATEEEAEVLIKGSLTIPDPGVSPEYAGKVGLKIKKLGINGEVSMRYAPKYPAYMVSAKIGLNKPIPLGPISLTAFSGLIGYRYVAEKEAIGMSSKDTWYDYYLAPQRGINVDKFSGPERTKDYNLPFSLGIGATFEATAAPKLASLRAMVLLSLPSMFAVDAGLNILSKRLGLAETDESEANFYAFVIFGDNSLEFGAGADYKLNKNGWFIELHADMQAGFFFKNQRPWYINFGTREKPVSALLFKDFLNLRSQAFLMISGKGIEAGARAEFKLNLGKYAKAWAIVEVGGKISLEKPQVGGYLYLEGGIDVNFRVIRITAVLSTYLSVELIKPFKIFAQLKFTFRIKFFFTIKINVKLTLKWEKSNEVDRKPIPAITYIDPNPSDDPDYYKPSTHREAVRGVHMITQEVFEIDYIPVVSSNLKTEEEQVSDYFDNKLDEIKVIPLDTYIDFKSEKALFPSKNLDAKIGGHTGIATDFIELIPPEKTVKGGHTIRQVKHKYIIEDIEIKAYTENGWIDYHPFKSLSPNTSIADVDLTKLKFGHWQRKNERYDSIRILASNPFSFLEGASSGWFIPEQYGITPSELFCKSEFTREHLSNFENLTTGTTFYPPAHYPAHFINGAYYNIKGDFYQSYEMDEDGNIKEVVSKDVMKVDFPINNNVKSLGFSNANTLVITLPQESVWVELELNSYLQDGVRIECKKIILDDLSGNILHEEVIAPDKTLYTRAEILNKKIVIESPKNANGEYDLSKAFSKIEITPQSSSLTTIELIKAEMNQIVERANLNTNGEIAGADLDRYEFLDNELKKLKDKLCVNINSVNINVSQAKFASIQGINTSNCTELEFSAWGYGYKGGAQTLIGNPRLINTQAELNLLYSSFITENGDSYFTPQIDFTNRSVLLLDSAMIYLYDPSVISSNQITINLNKLIRRADGAIDVCYDYSYDYLLNEMPLEGIPTRIYVFETEKIEDGSLLLRNYDCNCIGNSDSLCKEMIPQLLEYGRNSSQNAIIKIINSKEEYYSDYDIYGNLQYNVKYFDIDPETFFDNNSIILINDVLLSVLETNKPNFTKVIFSRESIDSLNGTLNICYDKNTDGSEDGYYLLAINKINIPVNFVLNQKCSCNDSPPPTETCRNLPFRNLIFNLDCRHENYFAKVINNQSEFNLEYGVPVAGPTIDFSSKSVILISFGIHISGEPKYFVNKVVKTDGKVNVCYTNVRDCNYESEQVEMLSYPYILLETDKLPDDFPIELNTNCNCSDTNNIVYNICDFADVIHEELLSNINYNLSFDDNREHFDYFMLRISEYDELTDNLYVIMDKFDWSSQWDDSFGSTLETALFSIKGFVNALKSLGCCIKDESQYSCHTYLQYVKWKTLEDYEYNITIPGIDAVKEDNMQAIDAQTKIVQPIWRPNTKYYIRFKVRDEVDNSKDPNSGIFNYYYGFRTVGPVGHFHKKHKEYLLDETKKDLNINDPNRYKKPEEFTITSLAPYIDYRRSYPNADGNILNAKPLFYGNEQCKINIYFDRPFAYHMLKKWEKYGDLPEYKGAMNIVIKDPVSEDIIPYPLPVELINLGEIPRPLDDGNWKDDNDPRMPLQFKILKKFIESQVKNNPNVNCTFHTGNPIAPKSPKAYSYEVKLTNLKPSKLYTAMVYNAFDDNADNEFNAQVDSSGNIIYEENQLVHQYVFATSRYANFRNQVMSYWLENKDENGVVISRKQAVFNIDLDLTDSQVNNAYTLVSGSSNTQTEILAKQYIDEFDRVLEGVLGMKPLDPPTCTDFVTIRNKNGEAIAILIRNPEPFNDPKISREDIANTIQVMRNGTENIKFKKLFSKDYSQVLIMHKTKVIEEKSLVFKFLYKTWNPENREYEINITDTNSTVVTDSIIINN